MLNITDLTEEERRELQEIIDNKSLKLGRFELASGSISSFFFDMKKTTLDPRGSKLITKAILGLVRRENVSYVGGPATGAIPIVSGLCLQSSPERPIFAFFVRRDESGRNPRIEGNVKAGERVIIVDDVTTEGNSIMSAIKAVREINCRVEKAITIVDRLANAEENLREMGVELIPIFTKDDFERIPKE